MLKEEVKKEYDSIASTWREKVWVSDADFQKRIIEFADFSGKENVLDVGIGAGDLSGLFNAQSVTGLDISQKMLNECGKLHSNFKLILGDAENLPFENNFFNVVCCRNLLQNFNNPTKAFKEMVRVLRPGGKLLVVESAVYENERKFPTDFCRVAEPFHPLFLSHELLRKLFISNSLKKVEQEVASVYKKWLAKWQRSKGATNEQKTKGYEICKNYPDWYKEKYKFRFFKEENEIQSKLTFSFIKGCK